MKEAFFLPPASLHSSLSFFSCFPSCTEMFSFLTFPNLAVSTLLSGDLGRHREGLFHLLCKRLGQRGNGEGQEEARDSLRQRLLKTMTSSSWWPGHFDAAGPSLCWGHGWPRPARRSPPLPRKTQKGEGDLIEAGRSWTPSNCDGPVKVSQDLHTFTNRFGRSN